MPAIRHIGKENVVRIYNGILFSHKEKSKIVTGKWITMLDKVTQIQKNNTIFILSNGPEVSIYAHMYICVWRVNIVHETGKGPWRENGGLKKMRERLKMGNRGHRSWKWSGDMDGSGREQGSGGGPSTKTKYAKNMILKPFTLHDNLKNKPPN